MLESCQAGPARLATGERRKKNIKTKRYVLLPRATGSSLTGALQGNSSEARCGAEEEDLDAVKQKRLRVASSSTSHQQQLGGGTGLLGTSGGRGGEHGGGELERRREGR
jgi:hypothetical protein